MHHRLKMRAIGLPSLLLLFVGTFATPLLAGEGASIALSRHALSLSSDWHKFVQDMPGRYVLPKAVIVEGDKSSVTNVDALLPGNDGETTLTLKSHSTARIVVDLGVLASGYVELGVVSASGAPIRLSYSEGKRTLGKNGDAPTDPKEFFYNGRTLGTDDDPDGRTDVFQSPRKDEVLTSPGLRGSERYIAITLDGPGTLRFKYIRIRQTNRIGRYDGNFLSNDDALNKAWYASAYALDLSTVRDRRFNKDAQWVIIDGPKRDRIVYFQDTWMNNLAGYQQGADYFKIAKSTLNLAACQQFPDGSLPSGSRIDVPCNPNDPGPADGPVAHFEPPGELAMARLDGFDMWWVISVADYFKHTGDAKFASAMLPVARKIIDFDIRHSPDGVLFRTDNYNGRYGFSWHTPDKAIGVDSSINAAYVGALKSLAFLERAVAHDTIASAKLEKLSEKVQRKLVEKLWDPAAGAMVLNSEDPKRDHTADANVMALLFDILNPQESKAVISFLSSRLGTPFGTKNSEYQDNPYMTQYISPYILGLEVLALFQHQEDQQALGLVRRAWTHMIDNGPGTPWEEVGVDGRAVVARPGTSLSGGEDVDLAHAWSTVVPALNRYVVGVMPAAVGYSRWSIRPHPVDLSWAQGTAPTPLGPITVRWNRGEGDTSFAITVHCPAGSGGELAVPTFAGSRIIAMDGKVLWKDEKAVNGSGAYKDGDYVVFSNVTGSHAFAWDSVSVAH